MRGAARRQLRVDVRGEPVSQLRTMPEFDRALQAARSVLPPRESIRVTEERETLAAQPKVARAHAREVASRARFAISDIAEVLQLAGENGPAAAAKLAFEALTRVISETYEEPPEGPETFACQR